jgi:hypothetical protein
MPQFSIESYLSGQFARDFEIYFTDNFPFREELLKISSTLEMAQGVRPGDVKIHAPDVPPPVFVLPSVDEAVSGTYRDDENDKTDTVSAEDEDDYDDYEEAIDSDVGVTTNGVFVIGGRAMSLYGGNQDAARYYAEILSSYPPLFPPGTIVYNGIIPTAVEFNLPERYRSLSPSQKVIIDIIAENLQGIIPVDIYSQLRRNRRDYLYFNTDHHWTPEGAYWAYVAFCRAAGLTPVPLSDFDKEGGSEFIGSMYRFTGDPKLLENPDTFHYYVPRTPHTQHVYLRGSPHTSQPTMLFHTYARGENTYSTILGGDFPLYVINTEAPGERSIVIIKESFGNAMVPYLVNHYRNIYVIDQRYFELSLVDFVRERNIGEVLFLNNAFAAVTRAHIDWINRLR